MDKIRIIGVPEHFNFPIVEAVEEQPFQGLGIALEWSDEPKGSGAMNKAIREGQAELAIILTESFIKDRIEGNPGKIIGYHVESPLIWGIHVSSQIPAKSVKELSDVPFLISRYGSGSHLMAFLLARKMGWDTKSLQFEVVGDLEGAKLTLDSSEPKIFLWEKYMTKPLVDKGLFRRVGEVPTPWPCFVMVASQNALETHPKILEKLRDYIYKKSSGLAMREGISLVLSKKYAVMEEDISAWLSQTRWATKNEVPYSSLETTMETLGALGLIKQKMAVEELVDLNLVKLV